MPVVLRMRIDIHNRARLQTSRSLIFPKSSTLIFISLRNTQYRPELAQQRLRLCVVMVTETCDEYLTGK